MNSEIQKEVLYERVPRSKYAYVKDKHLLLCMVVEV